MKKQVALGFIALSFLTLILSTGLVSAFWKELSAGDLSGAFNSLKFDVGALNTEWTVQVLLFFLAFIIIYGITDYLPFLGGKTSINFIFALIIAILATMFLRTEEIYAILGSYKALGVVITAIIPFLIISAISKRSYEKGHSMLGRILWIAFIVVLLWIILLFEKKDGSFGWVYLIVLGLALLMLFFEKTLYFFMLKSQLKDGLDIADQMAAAHLVAKIEELKDQMVYADSKTAEKLESRINDLQKKLDRLKK